jgi:hypothetical protein
MFFGLPIRKPVPHTKSSAGGSDTDSMSSDHRSSETYDSEKHDVKGNAILCNASKSSKSVTFEAQVTVKLIPDIEELLMKGSFDKIWYNPHEIKAMRCELDEELKKFMNDFDLHDKKLAFKKYVAINYSTSLLFVV